MTFKYQKWIKMESERIIINALFYEDKRFGELLEVTDLSKPVLIRRLKELKKKGKVEFVPEEETRRFYYRLNKKTLTIDDMIQAGIDALSNVILEGLKRAAKSDKTDIEYNKLLRKGIPLLFQYRMWANISAPKDLQSEWLKLCLGTGFGKDLNKIFPKNRRIFPEFIPYWNLAGNHPPDSKVFKEHLLEQINSTVEHLSEDGIEKINSTSNGNDK
jgi:DNA-binding HxlR family transcriptional regulator